MAKTITFITGGARSGKSRFALEMTVKYGKKVFIATAVAFDSEMKKRIAAHKRTRKGSFRTIEEPLDLATAIKGLPDKTGVCVVDCLTVWLGNLAHRYGKKLENAGEIEDFLKVIKNPPCDMIIVSNEIGMGIVPEKAMARLFRDVAGFVNQRIAELSDTVILMVSGQAMRVKGGKNLSQSHREGSSRATAVAQRLWRVKKTPQPSLLRSYGGQARSQRREG